ncbi:serine hydrolase domain-containing protein [Sphingomonas sp. PR090111-T3T-6A]|uniref:serine hydrolase domain-containing protein n=1 Tax=Sphingomonas sp. PR090111-T3T-6A TaxID=685778 RepID=UPI0003701B7F|nr:serine hydrolase domain-containing protein [Sphingomonas sp. PR090111-T3T-6A]
MKLVASVLALALLAAAPAPPPVLDRLIADAHFEGVVVAGSEDKPDTVIATGLAAKGEPNRADAIWRWASVSKQISTAIAMQEVEAGRLDLDQPVTTYWPDWPQVFSDRITMRDLLRHTSGLADPNQSGPTLPDGMPLFYRPPAGQGSMAYEATHFCAEHPRAEPGVSYHYNNCDFIVLGALLERTTGKSFASLVDERIAKPLGLSIGLFDPERPAVRHVLGLEKPGVPENIGNLGTYGASGSLYGSPLDLYAFDRALLTHRLLGEAATDAMWKGDPKLGAAALGQWQYSVTLAGCPAPTSIVERRGQIGGVQIRNFILPETKRALVLFTRRGDFDFGEVWQAKGFAYEMLSTIGCRA